MDPDNRRAYPWGNEDKDLIEYHKVLISLHKECQALKTGSIMFLHGGYNLICYGRFDEKDKVVVIINRDEAEREIHIPVWRLGIKYQSRMARIFRTDREGFFDETQMYVVDNGYIHVNCPGVSGIILKNMEDTAY